MVINKPVHLMCQHNSQWHTLRSLISSITIHQTLRKYINNYNNDNKEVKVINKG